MKKAILVFTAIVITTIIFSQAPEKMSYQAIIRDAYNNLVTNQGIGMQISIMQGSSSGLAIYTETHSPETNSNGLVTVIIGNGTTTNDFSAIDWAQGPYFIQTETDPTQAGGSDYTITGTSQLLSVPYALHAKTAENIKETDPYFISSVAADISEIDTMNWNNKLDAEIDSSITNEIQNLADVLSESSDAAGQTIKNLRNPVNDQDAATKAYVDALEYKLKELGILPFEKTDTMISDMDGNDYKFKKIGNQIWMVENLRTTKYNDGTQIPNITEALSWGIFSEGAFCWYDNDSISNALYSGALYNWQITSSDLLCPLGWHIPTISEFAELSDYLISNEQGYEGSGSDIGKSLADSSGWSYSSSPGTVGNDQASNNSSGFSAHDAGYRHPDGSFRYLNNDAYWWSSTEHDLEKASYRAISFNRSDFPQSNQLKNCGFSIRCVKD